MVQIGRVVQPINFVAGKFLEQAVLDHGAGAAEAFFGRLKDEMHGAVEIPGLREIARGAEQHGGVAVMAAAMEAAGNGRAPFQVGVLFHRQRVHVGAQPNALATAAFALEHADHAGAAEAAMHFDAPLGQFVGHDAGCPDFLEADFGMGVQIPADRREFLGIAFDAVDVGHVCYPVAEDVERDLVSGAKAGPFGLMRMPGRNRVHGNAAVSAGIAPGAAQMISFSAIGSKSARKCTELLLTRMNLGPSAALRDPTTTRTPPMRKAADGPRFILLPPKYGPGAMNWPSESCSTTNVASNGASPRSPDLPPSASLMVAPCPA